MNWQPMSTAHRDGTPVDLSTRFGRMTSMTYRRHASPPSWLQWSGNIVQERDVIAWMPIPEPPTAEQAAELSLPSNTEKADA